MKSRLDLSSIPAIHILSTHLATDDLHEYEDQVFAAHGKVVYDPKEARVFLARISQKKRAAFELRSKGIWTEEDTMAMTVTTSTADNIDDNGKTRKRKRPSSEDGSTLTHSPASNHDDDGDNNNNKNNNNVWPDLKSHVLVIRIEWLEACVKHNRMVPYQPQLIYYARVIPKAAPYQASTPALTKKITYIKATPTSATSVASIEGSSTSNSLRGRRRLPIPSRQSHRSSPRPSNDNYNDSRLASPCKEADQLPPLPSWATGPHAIYSCCRSTPMEGPNKGFIDQLAKIKETRVLTLDSIGVRAYSTAIASIAAYGHPVKHWSEIVRLPGCNERIANLWQEWHDSAATESERFLPEVRLIEADTDLQVLRGFYQIWGVGADTARRFYFKQGWRDIDDIVELGWQSLSRVQQIGVKYYDEFQIPIGRAESESIAATIKHYAQLALNEDNINGSSNDHAEADDIEVIIVGGYRRGKSSSGDVDVILSHRNENVTKDLITSVIRALEDASFITHTLVLQTANGGDTTLPLRSHHGHHQHGFDSLDKALCVWQDPVYAEQQQEEQQHVGKRKKPNPHRRVDIIIAPWRTVGCAVLGWSGGTTFQRDIRRFASKEKGWKFDSSGVRVLDGGGGSSHNGLVVDLEQPRPPRPASQSDWEWKDDWQSRERRVMEGLGIGWRPPEERCTG